MASLPDFSIGPTTMYTIAAPDDEWQIALDDLPGTDHGAPPRVYLHGLGASSAYFRDVVSHPAHRQARSLLIDLPGFGQSRAASSWSFSVEDHARVVADIAGRLRLRNVDVISHSMGGAVAIALAYHHPGIVGRLVLAEPALDPGRGVLSSHIARQSEARFVQRGYAALLHHAQRESARDGKGAALFVTTLKQAAPVALHRSALSLLAERAPTFRHMLESLSMPKALIHGARSELYRPACPVSGIAPIVVNDAGHVVMADNPVGFAEALHHALA